MNLFGEKKKMPRPDINGAITTLQQTITMLNNRKNHVERQIDSLVSDVKLCMRQNKKDAAMNLLKKKKIMQKSLEHVDNQLFNLESQKLSLEQIFSSQAVFDSMKKANEVLKETELDPEKVSDLMDDLQDNMALQEEVSAELGRPLLTISVDEEMEELEKLMAEELVHESLTNAPVNVQQQQLVLPSVPKTNYKQIQDDLKRKEKLEMEKELGLEESIHISESKLVI